MIIESIFIVFGLVWFTNAMFEKLNIWDDISRIGSNTSSEWVFKLTSCQFCVLFHIGWMWTIIVGAFNGFSWALLIVPFVVGGFIHLFGKNGL
jgi:hypothetical protein